MPRRLPRGDPSRNTVGGSYWRRIWFMAYGTQAAPVSMKPTRSFGKRPSKPEAMTWTKPQITGIVAEQKKLLVEKIFVTDGAPQPRWMQSGRSSSPIASYVG